MSGKKRRTNKPAPRYVTPSEHACEMRRNRRRKNRENQELTRERNRTFRRYMKDGIGSTAVTSIMESLDQIPDLKEKSAAKKQIIYLLCETRAFISSQFPDFYRSDKNYLEEMLSLEAKKCDEALTLCWDSLTLVQALLHSDAVPLRERYAQHLRTQDQKIRLLNFDCSGQKSKVNPKHQTKTELCCGILNDLLCALPQSNRRQRGGQLQFFKHALSTHLATILRDHNVPLKQPTRSPRKTTAAQMVSKIVMRELRFKAFDLAELARRSNT